jgi:hypothetical protein
MHMKLTKRGKRVRAVLILAAIVGGYWVLNHIWWVGDHYCFGEMIECYFGGE